MTCHSANSVHFGLETRSRDVAQEMPKRFSSATPPADQSTAATAASRVAVSHALLAERARTTRHTTQRQLDSLLGLQLKRDVATTHSFAAARSALQSGQQQSLNVSATI